MCVCVCVCTHTKPSGGAASLTPEVILLQVSCGGCHMLVSAKPRIENGDVASSEEEEDEEYSDDEDYSEKTDMNGTVRNSIDLNGTLSARNRRREKLPVR